MHRSAIRFLPVFFFDRSLAGVSAAFVVLDEKVRTWPRHRAAGIKANILDRQRWVNIEDKKYLITDNLAMIQEFPCRGACLM